jgi:hypothetical protein
VVVVVLVSVWWDRSFCIVAGPDAAVAQQCGLYDPNQHLFFATKPTPTASGGPAGEPPVEWRDH